MTEPRSQQAVASPEGRRLDWLYAVIRPRGLRRCASVQTAALVRSHGMYSDNSQCCEIQDIRRFVMNRTPQQKTVRTAEKTGAQCHQTKADADTPPFTRIRWLPGSSQVMRVDQDDDDILSQEHDLS